MVTRACDELAVDSLSRIDIATRIAEVADPLLPHLPMTRAVMADSLLFSLFVLSKYAHFEQKLGVPVGSVALASGS